MRKTPLIRAQPLALVVLGCPNKPAQPVVLTEQVGTLPVQFSA